MTSTVRACNLVTESTKEKLVREKSFEVIITSVIFYAQSITVGNWYTAVITSYKQMGTETKVFNVYLNSGDSSVNLTEHPATPYIPTISPAPTVYICGTSDGSGVIGGGYADIIRLEILSPAGGFYPEDEGIKFCF